MKPTVLPNGKGLASIVKKTPYASPKATKSITKQTDKLQAFGANVVGLLESKERKTAGGIHLTNSHGFENYIRVDSVGADVEGIKKGDVIVTTTGLTLKGTDWMILHKDQILAIRVE